MGTTLTAIPFWSDQITVGEVDSASSLELFHSTGKPLQELVGESRASLYDVEKGDGSKLLLLKMADGGFIEFTEKQE